MKTGMIITIVVIVAVLGLALVGFMMTSSTINSNVVANPIVTDTSTVVTANPNANPGTNGADNYNVLINNYAFSPSSISIHVGDSVTWTNQDSVSHTVISDSGTGNELGSGVLGTGNSYTHKFTTSGIYYYHCSIHPMMTGEVIVQ